MRFLIKRTYQYTTEEWVEANSEKEALDTPATSGEIRNYDDFWQDAEVIDSE
jgi:hypothetical protein